VARILIGANSEVARVGLASVLSKNRALQLLGSLSIDDALAQFQDFRADVVLLDLESPADELMSVATESNRVALSPVLVILADHAEKIPAAGAFRSGVRAILPREATSEEIFAAIQASVAGLVVLHPDALGSVLPLIQGREQPALDSSDQLLTAREIEVLRMIAEGLGNKEIASKLRISEHTVKFHISSIFAKLGSSNRAEAVTIGIREGLIMV
jgi:two-component system, NarL family, response regulator YdfI